MLVVISDIANNGKICVPRLVKRIESAAGETIKDFPHACASRVPVSAKSIMVVREALRRVVQNPCGTGKIARIEGLELAGKTGTAQVVSLRVCEKNLETPFHLRDHAWFVAFAPFKDPKISVVVLVEHGGFGSSAAGPIAREIIDYYLNKTIKLRN
jgi:penicillin-binding protein 2